MPGIALTMQDDSSSEAENQKPLSEDDSGEDLDLERPPAAESGEAEGSPVEHEEEEEKVEPSPEEQAAEWRERAIRAAADLENFRKRMEREKGEARRYANQSLLEELLPVLDNFHMGLEAASADSESMIFKGMEMVKKQLDDFLAGQGVEEIPAEEKIFDPAVHEAVAQEDCEDSPEGIVLRVIRRGYRMGDRLLRPANVVVSRAPQPEEPKQEMEENA